MIKHLTQLANDPKIQVRGKGMMIGIDLADGEQAKQVVTHCFNHGLLLGACGTGGRVIKLIPPLTIEDGDLDTGMAIVIEAIEKTKEGAK